MNKVLVTAIGSFSAEAVIDTLIENKFEVIGCDIYPKEWHFLSKKIKNFYQVPSTAQEKDYVEKILKICLDENINIIIPSTDLDVDIFNKNKEIFEKENVNIYIQNKKALEISRDKYKLYKTFLNSHIHVIPTLEYKEIETLENFPYIAKPKNGRSSEGVLQINKIKDLEKIEDKDKDNYIIQEYINGSIIVADYIRDKKNNKDFSIVRKELIRTKNGAGIVVEMHQNKKISDICSYIGNELDINGCICIEFIEKGNEYYVMDINPRFSAGVAFSKKIGYEVVINHLKCFMGIEIDEPINIPTKIISKRYIEEIL